MPEHTLLSILIPVYNASMFLRRCLNSIVLQDEFTEYVTLVVVDDGSKDDSLQILNSYKEKHANMVVVTRENRGIGATRNELLSMVETPYFWFVDADDYISSSALSIILPLLQSAKYDMLLMSYFWGNEDHGKTVTYHGEFESGMDMADREVYNNSLWTRIYRTEVVRNSNIHFRQFKMGEDFDFIFRLIPFLGRIKCVESTLYNYVVTPNSAITNASIEHKMEAAGHSLTCLEQNYCSLNGHNAKSREILKKPLAFFLLGYINSIYVVPFSLDYKRQAFTRLEEVGAIPISPLPIGLKRRLFVLLFNTRIFRRISLYVNYSFLKLFGNERC